jgi:hypothetical protein
MAKAAITRHYKKTRSEYRLQAERRGHPTWTRPDRLHLTTPPAGAYRWSMTPQRPIRPITPPTRAPSRGVITLDPCTGEPSPAHRRRLIRATQKWLGQRADLRLHMLLLVALTGLCGFLFLFFAIAGFAMNAAAPHAHSIGAFVRHFLG